MRIEDQEKHNTLAAGLKALKQSTDSGKNEMQDNFDSRLSHTEKLLEKSMETLLSQFRNHKPFPPKAIEAAPAETLPMISDGQEQPDLITASPPDPGELPCCL